MLGSRKGRSLAVLAVAALLMSGVATSLHASEPVDPVTMATLQEMLDVSELVVEYVSVPEALQDQEKVVVPLDGIDHTLVLERHSLRSPDFVATINGNEVIEAPEPRTYLGAVAGIPESTVVASLLPDGELRAIIEVDENFRWGVQMVPASLGLEEGMHAVFRLGDIVPPAWVCGTPDVDPTQIVDSGVTDAIERGVGTAQNVCELACDADFPFYQLNGSNVANTINDIEFVLEGVANIYRRDVDITYEITFINVWTTINDPYTSNDSGVLLAQFQGYWQGNFGAVPRDLSHLFTGTNIAGSVIGRANGIGNICNSAYCFSQSRYSLNINLRRSLTAHEFGHNWSGTHCDGSNDCRIMCSGNGGCTGDVTQFGQAAKNQINQHENSRNCLTPQPVAATLPFTDLFDSIQPDSWTWVRGAGVTAQAENEPSPTTSLNLDGFGGGLFQQDIIRSNWIDTTGANAVLSYWVQKRGVGVGETLTVRYWTNLGHWSTLNTIVGDGSTESHFRFYVHQLPTNSRHDNFRIEFATTADSFSEDYFVDNVNVDDATILPGAMLSASIVNPGDTIFLTASVENLTGVQILGQNAWIDVFAPDNSPLFASNPKFGPKTFNLNGSQTKTKSGIPINVPGSAASGQCRVVVYVGTFPNQVMNAVERVFTVQ